MGNTPTLSHLRIEDPVQLIKMYLLYLDESGTHSSARHFVLAGVSVYETNVKWAADQLDCIQSQHFPDLSTNLVLSRYFVAIDSLWAYWHFSSGMVTPPIHTST